jgi:hypothetical protein
MTHEPFALHEPDEHATQVRLIVRDDAMQRRSRRIILTHSPLD